MTPFQKLVYNKLKEVPRGKVTTYKALTEAIGSKAYRAVGNALKVNPMAPQVPCHRVVKADGSIGGFMGFKTGPAIDKKIKLLATEGVQVEKGIIQNFSSKLHQF